MGRQQERKVIRPTHSEFCQAIPHIQCDPLFVLPISVIQCVDDLCGADVLNCEQADTVSLDEAARLLLGDCNDATQMKIMETLFLNLILSD